MSTADRSHILRNSLLLLAALLLLALLAWRGRDDLRAAFALCRQARVWPLAAALAFQCGYYVCAGLVVRGLLRLVDYSAPFWWTVRATFLLIFVSRIVPGPAATGPAVMYFLLERRGLSRTKSAFIGPMFYAVDYGVFFLMLAGAMAVVAFRHRLTRGDIASLPFLVAALAILGGLAWLFRRPRRVEAALRPMVSGANRFATALRLKHRVADDLPGRVASEAGEVVERLRERPALAWRVLAAATAMLLCDAATMGCAFLAFGVWLPASSVAFGFCLSTMGALVSVLPGGLGTFDAAMVIGFTSLGSPRPAALAATLVYRVIGSWFPALPGLYAYNHLLTERRTMKGE